MTLAAVMPTHLKTGFFSLCTTKTTSYTRIVVENKKFHIENTINIQSIEIYQMDYECTGHGHGHTKSQCFVQCNVLSLSLVFCVFVCSCVCVFCVVLNVD